MLKTLLGLKDANFRVVNGGGGGGALVVADYERK